MGKWLKEEEDLLVSLCNGDNTLDDLEKLIKNKSKSAIEHKCARLQLGYLVKKDNKNGWTEYEINILRKNEGKKATEIQKELISRSLKSIESKMYRLGLKVDKKNVKYNPSKNTRPKMTLQYVNQWLESNNCKYEAIDVKKVKKTYQTQFWVLMKCENRCHAPYWVWWNHFKRGHRCITCYSEKLRMIKSDDYEKALKKYNEYGLYPININDFKSTNTPLKCSTKDGYEVNVRLNNLLRKDSFSDVENDYFDSFMSYNEKLIKKILTENNIPHIPQYKISDCKYKNILRFDFAIFDKYNNLQCLIEYDGKQHFEPVNFGGISDERAKEEFDKVKIRDGIKNEYCLKSNIKLIRIPYYNSDNLEEILINTI